MMGVPLAVVDTEAGEGPSESSAEPDVGGVAESSSEGGLSVKPLSKQFRRPPARCASRPLTCWHRESTAQSSSAPSWQSASGLERGIPISLSG